MKCKETMTQKDRNVSLLFFFILINVMAQQGLRGTFCKTERIPGFGTCLEFSPDGSFKYVSGGDINYFGEGTYIKQNNQLILNYKSLPPLKMSYHTLAIWQNFSDSIKIEIKVYDLDKNPFPGVNVLFQSSNEESESVGFILNEKGEGILKFNTEKKEIELEFTYLGYQPHKVNLTNKHSYQLEVFLSKDVKDIPIEENKKIYIIEKSENDFLRLRNEKNKVMDWNIKSF